VKGSQELSAGRRRAKTAFKKDFKGQSLIDASGNKNPDG